MSQIITLAKLLISKPSITPNDAGCQPLLIERLAKIGFKIEPLKFGKVANFWATHGSTAPVFVFAGHTDVVPVGDGASWHTDAFTPTLKDGLLFGRGAADMKGSLAAMIVATERFISDFPKHKGTIGFLITADEEGDAVDGTVKVLQQLKKRGQLIDYCLIGEPSADKTIGDTIKNGRRGSLNGVLTVFGKQGHIAYPQLADNPINGVLPALDELCRTVWDEANEYFSASSFQISNIHSGAGVTNVIPAQIEVIFNFRYNTASTHQQLQQRVEQILASHHLKFKIDWSHSGYPFLTAKGDLVRASVDAIKKIKGIESQLSTSGGTSDGRFIAAIMNAQVVELGPVNATIHQANECVSVQDLEDLGDIYYQILKNSL